MTNHRTLQLGELAVAAVAFGAAILAVTSAFAGECPADQVLSEPAEVEIAPDVDVKRELLATVDLTGWRDMGHFMLRTRRLTVAPHGIVPTHAHDDRPAIIFIMQGEMIEHNSLCAVPIHHVAGEYSPEFGAGHIAWWENPSDQEAIILSADVVPFQAMDDPNM